MKCALSGSLISCQTHDCRKCLMCRVSPLLREARREVVSPVEEGGVKVGVSYGDQADAWQDSLWQK